MLVDAEPHKKLGVFVSIVVVVLRVSPVGVDDVSHEEQLEKYDRWLLAVDEEF